MNHMDLAGRKLLTIKWLSNLNDENLLSKFEGIIEDANENFYLDYLRPSTQEQKDHILKESEADYKAGRIFTQKSIEEKYKVNR